MGRVSTDRPPSALPEPFSSPWDSNAFITVGPDDNLWFTASAGNHAIGCITKDGSPCGAYVIPYNPEVDAPSKLPFGGRYLWGITVGPDNNLYFTESAVNKIGRLNLTTKAVDEWDAPGAPYGLTVGRDGNLWFTESDGNKIGRFNLTTKTVDVEAIIPTFGSGPYEITAGPR